jgi:hypothetical protein
VRLYFCTHILQRFYLYTSASIRKKQRHRRVIACVCIFVHTSCKYFTSIQTHPSEKTTPRHRRVIVVSSSCHRRVIACVCIFVNASCKDLTKILTHPSEKTTPRRQGNTRLRNVQCQQSIAMWAPGYFQNRHRTFSSRVFTCSSSSSCHRLIACVCIFL